MIERPIRPFGAADQLYGRSQPVDAAARDRNSCAGSNGNWPGIQKMQKAKSILMEKQGMTEEHAYKALRQQAMGKRVTVEDIAAPSSAQTTYCNASERCLDLSGCDGLLRRVVGHQRCWFGKAR